MVAAQENSPIASLSAEQNRAALAKQVAVMQFVDRVLEVQTPQQRIRRHLRRAQDVAAALGLDVREGQELSHTPVIARPYPSVKRTHEPVECRAMALASLLVAYRRESTVERGVRVTHDVLLAMIELARRRGALGLVVVPQFGDEDAGQRALRERILTAEIPVALVHLNPDWRLAWDRHPNADAALAVATAIASRLHTR